MKYDVIIRTEQTIPSLKYIHKDDQFDEERSQELERSILRIFNKAYRPHGIELVPHEVECLHFTIRTLNYDGECKTDELRIAYHFFTGICEALELKVA